MAAVLSGLNLAIAAAFGVMHVWSIWLRQWWILAVLIPIRAFPVIVNIVL